MNILLIDDDQVDAKEIQRMVNQSLGDSSEVTQVAGLSTGLGCLERGGVDLVLLDLGLPDSQGLETLEKVLAWAPDVPVVVLTGADDEEAALGAVRKGAQDYLIKGQVDGQLLVRSMRYAIERQQLQGELDEARRKEQEERERAETLQDLEHYRAIGLAEELGELNGLPDRDAKIAHALVPKYREIVETYLRSGRVRDDPWSQRVREFAGQLAALRFGSRSVMQLHLGVMNRVTNQVLLDMQRGVSREEHDGRSFSKDGRLVLVELLADLLEIYRSAALEK